MSVYLNRLGDISNRAYDGAKNTVQINFQKRGQNLTDETACAALNALIFFVLSIIFLLVLC